MAEPQSTRADGAATATGIDADRDARAGRPRTGWSRWTGWVGAKLGSQCAVCDGWGAQALCSPCWGQAQPSAARCRRCALPAPQGPVQGRAPWVCSACTAKPPPWARAVAAVDYAFPWNQLVTAFKRVPQPALAVPLAALLSTAVRAHDGRYGQDGAQAAHTAPWDLIVPMPLALPRLRQRGFNPAWELARRVSRDLGCAAAADVLFRVRDTSAQAGLNRTERQANVRNAFAVSSPGMDRLRGRHIALVDDVLTTGATAAEATRALLRAGAAQVDVWAVARTPERTEP